MSDKISIRFYGNRPVRAIWDEENSKWWFSVLDIIFTQKYPNDANRILKPFEAANQCPATWENLTKYRLQSFVNYLAERIAPNSVHL